ncbi:hypothetical protein PFISCL1PPCAC_14135 [Pristionchus fissidentatus]|uniref:Glutathione S-transferase n=1 Tax=Pristionchus fissidentatus TaxID=1538716 RepID=A0AAV5VWU8_9BILA|nr:hypothetical protein PFISCL1PPCAC_14135 [Pristionchus fissidentatus]
MPLYKLTYFDLRARGEPIRMMFAIGGIDFEDNRVDWEEWEKLAKSTATPFSALPMIEVDGVKIAQTLAILRYVARETGYAGPDNLTSALADSLADQCANFVMAFMDWHMDALYTSCYLPARAKHLPFFEQALSKSSTGWFANTPDLTHADVFIAGSLEWLLRMDPNAKEFYDGFPLLEAHAMKFFAHPKLQKHLEERPETRY